MNILIISNMYPSKKDPVYGTFVQSFVESVQSLNIDGQTKTVLIKGRNGNSFQRISRYVGFYLCVLFRLLFYRYDIIYVHTISHPIPIIFFLNLFLRLPLVFNVHGSDVLTRGKLSKCLKNLARSSLRKSLLVVSPSLFFKDVLLREFPFLLEDKIFVSPSGGVNDLFYERMDRSVGAVPTIGYVSHIKFQKGFDVLLKAVSLLKERGVECKVIFAGRDVQGKDLSRLSDELSILDCVEYLGPVPHASLPQVFRRFDLFVFPTCLEESLGLVGLEAMACGVPVVGSRIGGLTDYIKDGENGFFFATGDAIDLSEKIIHYFSLSIQQKKKLSLNAYDTALAYKSSVVQQALYFKLQDIVADKNKE